MVRRRMMRVGSADFGIAPAAELAADHERRDARHVRLIRQHLQVEHQLAWSSNVAGTPIGCSMTGSSRAPCSSASGSAARRRGSRRGIRRASRRSCGPTRRCSRASFVGHRVEHAPVLRPCAPPRRASVVRCRRTAARRPHAGCSPSAAAWSRPPGDRARVVQRTRRRSSPHPTHADFERQLERCQLASPAAARAPRSDPPRSPASTSDALGVLGQDAGQELRARAGVDAGALRPTRVAQAGQRRQAIAMRRSGLRIRLSSKPLPSPGGVHCSMRMPFGRYTTPRR